MYAGYSVGYGYGNAEWNGYGNLSLTVDSPPQSFLEPVSADEARIYMKLPVRSPSDPAETETLSGLVSAAREMAETLQQRDLVVKQWDLARDYWPCDGIIRLRSPLVSVDLVQYRDSTGTTHSLTENIDYVVDRSRQPGIITPPFNRTWPAFTPQPTSAILVRFTSGMTASDPFWAARGNRVKTGMKRLVLEFWGNRIPTGAKVEELPFGVTALLSAGANQRVR